MAVGDFNGDGKLDLAVQRRHFYTNSVGVLLGNGDGTFQTVVGYMTGQMPHSVAVADFNGDGKPDLVATNYRQRQRKRAAGQRRRHLPDSRQL